MRRSSYLAVIVLVLGAFFAAPGTRADPPGMTRTFVIANFNRDPLKIGQWMPFQGVLNCSGPTSVHRTLVQGNSTSPDIPVAIGSTCVLSEPFLPPLPPDCGWILPPVFAPQPMVMVADANRNRQTMSNAYGCTARIGRLTIKISVVDPLGAAGGQTFPVSWHCYAANGVSQGQGSFSARNGGTATTNPLVLPALCQVTEQLPGTFNKGLKRCSWLQPAYDAAYPVRVNSPTKTVTLTNNYACRPVLP